MVDATPVQWFRRLFGVLLALMPIRFAAYGWIEALYLEPSFHFPWVAWAVVPSAPVLYGLHALLAVCGVLIATGPLYRPALAVYLLGFGYLELLDKTLYLNHYVLVSLLLGWLLILPLRPGQERTSVWVVRLLQLQLAQVWFWAGVCKLNSDWLLRGEPLHTWLRARMELPVVGPWLALPETALLMSWGGMLFDLSIAFLLWFPRTRIAGFVLLLGFHAVTGLLFPIGVFPWVMLVGSLLFAPPSWFGATDVVDRATRPRSLPVWLGLAAVVFLVPLRHVAYPGWVNWNERGFRFAWRVLLIEKTGHVEFRVVDGDRTWTVYPSRELPALQYKQMRTQPDMIWDYAQHVAARNRAHGREVQVYVDAWASLNGRPSQRLVDPGVDLAHASAWGDWIVPIAAPDAILRARR